MTDPEKYWKELSGRLGENIEGYVAQIVALSKERDTLRAELKVANDRLAHKTGDYVTLDNDIAALWKKFERYKDALRLVVPLANSFVTEYPDRNDQCYVDQATQLLEGEDS